MKTTLVICAALIGTTLFSDAWSEAVEPKRLSEIVRVLASDEFEGRSPGTQGETKTINYLVETFRGLGLEPGGERGGWTQPHRVEPSRRRRFRNEGCFIAPIISPWRDRVCQCCC